MFIAESFGDINIYITKIGSNNFIYLAFFRPQGDARSVQGFHCARFVSYKSK